MEQAIHCAKNARFSALLSRDLKRAERHYADICELNEGGWNNHIPEIDRQSVFELYRLRKPKDEIYHTMKAVYMLLGFDTSEIQVFESHFNNLFLCHMFVFYASFASAPWKLYATLSSEKANKIFTISY